MTLRDLYNLTAAARGHWVVCGTPQRIADTLEEWFVEAADGFNILPPYFPGAPSPISSISWSRNCNAAGCSARIRGIDLAGAFRAGPRAESVARQRRRRKRPEASAHD